MAESASSRSCRNAGRASRCAFARTSSTRRNRAPILGSSVGQKRLGHQPHHILTLRRLDFGTVYKVNGVLRAERGDRGCDQNRWIHGCYARACGGIRPDTSRSSDEFSTGAARQSDRRRSRSWRLQKTDSLGNRSRSRPSSTTISCSIQLERGMLRKNSRSCITMVFFDAVRICFHGHSCAPPRGNPA